MNARTFVGAGVLVVSLLLAASAASGEETVQTAQTVQTVQLVSPAEMWITTLLTDKDRGDRKDAAKKLGDFGGSRALTALEYAAANDKDHGVRKESQKAAERVRARILAAQLTAPVTVAVQQQPAVTQQQSAEQPAPEQPQPVVVQQPVIVRQPVVVQEPVFVPAPVYAPSVVVVRPWYSYGPVCYPRAVWYRGGYWGHRGFHHSGVRVGVGFRF
jgi:hypothetical protein